MPRPPCPRTIAHRPPSHFFKPAGIPLRELAEITLAADEMEALRLADHEDLYRVDAAERMGVSRQTFDRILKRARQRIAHALVGGHALRIQHHLPAETPHTTPAADDPAAGRPPRGINGAAKHDPRPHPRLQRFGQHR